MVWNPGDNMRLFRQLSLYMALTLGANAALAADPVALADMRQGDMKKLVLHSAPKPVSSAEFQLADGAGTATLGDYQGKIVLLNFWATWCAPCRKEMPQLSELQEEFGGDDFEVLTLATGRNSPAGIQKFFDDTGITNLPRHQDPRQAVAREMAVLGLPITVLLNREGEEIARLRGDAEWNSDSAKTIIRALIASD
ncbi:disulfide interchange protein tlpA-like protein [Phaeobacter gallaeciensis]|uniref:Disulfide interchange protein tlpA-like protein n=2 Tax=Phaeobacter gallaeciensis TaxID=60890 RepID=A0AAC9ZBQ1_9RHOB|nr:TlpA disulfide reductase family protein [Phaeobacter gallaeciensis]AHD10886.1 Thiol-disulfide isomerase and thioredoxin [Phaeobacter gallaeciensis DSM 26640]ATE94149.1 disulfide interchange protein tlpA-like protein [Phaeobacter gallaeciensis]ATE96030.1 disulfide interchange protein tlpA-like protein [Phaeobacter gallaeciensis]ATF02813.1 disulfide interchange protein tlpA-like protein [Phaeobacter gallaeciensis]ATF07193.1 disulfide interchange protein tlpA-like protein [Phaeobacter gallaeci